MIGVVASGVSDGVDKRGLDEDKDHLRTLLIIME